MSHLHRITIMMAISVIIFASIAIADANNDTFKISDPDLSSQNMYVLVIAIDDYDSWRPLKHPVSDATQILDVLKEDYGVKEANIFKPLYNKDATKSTIINTLKDLAKKNFEEESSLIIYYSGHGDYDKNTKIGYWVPVDSDKDDVSTYINNAELLSYFINIKVKHLLLVSDSCFSGSLIKDGNKARYDDEIINTRISRQVITSGNIEETADDSPLPKCDGHSTFACFFIDELKRNKNKTLTANEIYLNISKPITNNSNQMPQFGILRDCGDEGGEFVLFGKYNNNISENEPKHIESTPPIDIPAITFLPYTPVISSETHNCPDDMEYISQFKGLCMDRTEVTIGDYCQRNQCDDPVGLGLGTSDMSYPLGSGTGLFNDPLDNFNCIPNRQVDEYPVTMITFEMAREYCETIGKRLPTKNEWEYAAGGQSMFVYPWGNNWFGKSHTHANYYDGVVDGEKKIDKVLKSFSLSPSTTYSEYNFSKIDGFKRLAPVGSFKDGKSPFNIYDMAGNVSEWVCSSQGKQMDVCIPVAKGGSWASSPEELKISNDQTVSYLCDHTIGFRCAMDLK